MTIERTFEYAGKIVCGLQKDPEDMRLEKGAYATTINIHNPNDVSVKFFKKLALTFPPGGQKPGQVIPIGDDVLRPDEALELDCIDIQRRFFPNGFPTFYIEGFIIIKSKKSLDVTAIYSTAAIGKLGQATDHSSIHVEQVQERIREEVPRPPLDITIENIEITQAIQATTNTIQPVAQRSTAVRATINTGGGPVSGVTGKLHVFVDGIRLTPVGGIAPINAPLTAPASPQRSIEDHTLNFELPCPTGIPESTDVDFRVDIMPVVDEDNALNNSGQVNNLSFISRKTPNLFFTRINWGGIGLPALSDVQHGVGDAFVQGIYPVNDCDPDLYRQGLFPTLNWPDENTNGTLDAGSEVSNLLSALANIRNLIVFFGLGATDNTFLYGWIKGNPISGNGWGQVSGFVAFGNTQHIRHQRTYAHELGHNFGLGHNNRTLAPEVGWDVGGRLDGNPVTNNTTGRVKPSTLNDIMRGGQLTNSAWVDVITYNFFMSSSILIASTDSSTDQYLGSDILVASADGGGIQIPYGNIIRRTTEVGSEQKHLSERVLVIQGIFNPEGDKLVYLKPVFRFPWLSEPTPISQKGRFIAEIEDKAGSVTRVYFDALVADDSGEEGEETHGFFEVMVAISPYLEVESLRIMDSKDGRVFGGFKRSKPPKIEIMVPKKKAKLGGETRVAWQVRDQDTPEEELLYQVAYSPDGGQSWVPIGIDAKGTSFTFNSTEIQRSKGKGVIRVFVSDGLNTAFAAVSGLTTTAAIY